MKLRIEKRPDHAGDPPRRGFLGRDYRYYLDDFEVTDALRELRLNMGTGDANEARITFLLEDVEVDAEALIALQAKLERVDQAEPVDVTTAGDEYRSYACDPGGDPS